MLSSSFKPNHYDKSKCLIIDNIIKNMPELEDFKEPLNPTKIKLCMHNSLCYEAECGFAHTYTIEARKKIRQAYLKEMKKQKLEEFVLSSQSKIEELLNEYRLYDPEKENGCDTFERCEYLLNSRFDALLGFRIKDLKLNSRTLNYLKKELLELKKLKIEEYRTKFDSESHIVIDIHPTSNPSQEYKIIDKAAQKYLEESIKEHTKIRREEEYRRLQQQEYEETKKKIKEQLHSLVEMPSRLFGRLMSSSSKKLDINEKINIWSDKIIEMISDLSVWKPQKCENLDECIDKITTIIDIINSFVERPNTMINQEFSISSHTNNKYNIQKNKIYENFLYDYKITFTDKELEHPEYLKLLEDYSKILIVLQNMKLDDCKNTFSEEKTGGWNGKKLKTLKSKSDLKNKKKK